MTSSRPKKWMGCVCVLALGCVPAGSDEGQASDGSSETGSGGDGDGDMYEACIGDAATAATLTITAATWPRTLDGVTQAEEAVLDAECVVDMLAADSMNLTCAAPDAVEHAVTIAWSGTITPSFAGLASVHVRWLLDSWHDVTMQGDGEWLRLADPGTGELLAAAMSGRAEFIGVLPKDGVADDWYAPLIVEASSSACAADAHAIAVTPVDGPQVFVRAPGSAELSSGGVDYSVRVGAFEVQDQGPEYPSTTTLGLIIVGN